MATIDLNEQSNKIIEMAKKSGAEQNFLFITKSKPIYKPNGTQAVNIIAGKSYTVWYNAVGGGNFFAKTSAEGTAATADVLVGKTFSNENDTGISGDMANRGAVYYTPSAVPQYIQEGYHNGGGLIFGNSSLISANIKSGATIFGVAGKTEVVDTTTANPPDAIDITQGMGIVF